MVMVLLYDENWNVRKVARNYLKEHNYKTVIDWAKDNSVTIDLDWWLNSDDEEARIAAAKQGYGLDKLVNDKDWHVRKEVAKQCYGLDKPTKQWLKRDLDEFDNTDDFYEEFIRKR